MEGNRNKHVGSESVIQGDDNWSKGNGLEINQNGYREQNIPTG
jgi:hypothetical protein